MHEYFKRINKDKNLKPLATYEQWNAVRYLHSHCRAIEAEIKEPAGRRQKQRARTQRICVCVVQDMLNKKKTTEQGRPLMLSAART